MCLCPVGMMSVLVQLASFHAIANRFVLGAYNLPLRSPPTMPELSASVWGKDNKNPVLICK